MYAKAYLFFCIDLAVSLLRLYQKPQANIFLHSFPQIISHYDMQTTTLTMTEHTHRATQFIMEQLSVGNTTYKNRKKNERFVNPFTYQVCFQQFSIPPKYDLNTKLESLHLE